MPVSRSLSVTRDEFLMVDRSPLTIRDYRNVLAPLLEWFARQSPPITALEAVTFAALNRYVSEVLLGRQKAGTMTGRTPNQHVVVIRGFFKWCMKIGYLEQSPAQGLTIRKPKAKPPETRAMPLQVFVEMLRRAKLRAMGGEPNLYALLTLLADTTHRVGAVVRAKVGDLDLPGRRILLQVKGGDWKYAYFADAEVLWALNALLHWRRQVGIPHEFLFSTLKQPYKGVSPGGASNRIGEATQELCGVRYHAHSIRHLMAIQMDAQGLDPSAASARLGNTQEVYIGHYQPSPAHKRAEQVTRAYPLHKLLGEMPAAPTVPASPGTVIEVNFWEDEEVV